MNFSEIYLEQFDVAGYCSLNLMFPRQSIINRQVLQQKLKYSYYNFNVFSSIEYSWCRLQTYRSILVILGPIHTDARAFSFENAHILIRFRLSSTLKRPKTKTFENGFKSGDVLKRIVLKNAPFLVWTSENGDF